MDGTSNSQPSWEDFSKHEKRIKQLEERVEQLLIANAIQIDQPATGIDPEQGQESQSPTVDSPSSNTLHSGEDISPALHHIVVQMRNGNIDEAYKEFQALPRSELSRQPVTAATIAAAICVTQGDFQAGIKALEHVQQFSNDPRIEQIKQKLVDQADKE